MILSQYLRENISFSINYAFTKYSQLIIYVKRVNSETFKIFIRHFLFRPSPMKSSIDHTTALSGQIESYSSIVHCRILIFRFGIIELSFIPPRVRLLLFPHFPPPLKSLLANIAISNISYQRLRWGVQKLECSSDIQSQEALQLLLFHFSIHQIDQTSIFHKSTFFPISYASF